MAKVIDGKLISIDECDIIDGIVKVEDGVKEIEENSFNGVKVKEIIFSNSVSYISPNFIDNLHDIHSLTIPKFISYKNLKDILEQKFSADFNFYKIFGTFDTSNKCSLGDMKQRVELTKKLYDYCIQYNLHSDFINKMPKSLLNEIIVLTAHKETTNGKINSTIIFDKEVVKIKLEYINDIKQRIRTIEIKTNSLSVLENIFMNYNEEVFFASIKTLKQSLEEVEKIVDKKVFEELIKKYKLRQNKYSIENIMKYHFKYLELIKLCQKFQYDDLKDKLIKKLWIFGMDGYVISCEENIVINKQKYIFTTQYSYDEKAIVINYKDQKALISFSEIDYLNFLNQKEVKSLMKIESEISDRLNNESIFKIRTLINIDEKVSDFFEYRELYNKLKEVLKYYRINDSISDENKKILQSITDDSFRGIIGYLNIDLLKKKYSYELTDNLYLIDEQTKDKTIITDYSLPIQYSQKFSIQIRLLKQLKHEIDSVSEQINEVSENPVIRTAMRFKNSNIDPELIEQYKPIIDEEFLLRNLIIINSLGLLKYLNLSDITFTNIENLDLSYSNVRINLKNYKSIRNTNLTNVPLLFQSLDGIDASRANLKGTHVLIDVSKTITDETIFDETCIFWQGKRELTKEEAKLLGLIVQDVDVKKITLKLPKRNV